MTVTWLFEEPWGWAEWTHSGDNDMWTKVRDFSRDRFDETLDEFHYLGLDFVVKYSDGSAEYHLALEK